MMNQVNTAVSETDCSYMNGWTPEQIHGAIASAWGDLDEQVNVIVSGLMRLPEGKRRGKLAAEILRDIEDRILGIRAAG